MGENEIKKIKKEQTIVFSILGGVILVVILMGFSSMFKNLNFDLGSIGDNKAIKVDISMTSYYGNIDYILDELGLDFDLVTMGANCYTGVQKNEFKTEKYGILHTEFRYCKSNSTQVFRVYNTEEDQPLREPRYGELPSFDRYGKVVSRDNNDSL